MAERKTFYSQLSQVDERKWRSIADQSVVELLKLSPDGQRLFNAVLNSPEGNEIVAKLIMAVISPPGRPRTPELEFWYFHAFESEVAFAKANGEGEISERVASQRARVTIAMEDAYAFVRGADLESLPGWDVIRRRHRQVLKTMIAEGRQDEVDALRKDLRLRHEFEIKAGGGWRPYHP